MKETIFNSQKVRSLPIFTTKWLCAEDKNSGESRGFTFKAKEDWCCDQSVQAVVSFVVVVGGSGLTEWRCVRYWIVNGDGGVANADEATEERIWLHVQKVDSGTPDHNCVPLEKATHKVSTQSELPSSNDHCRAWLVRSLSRLPPQCKHDDQLPTAPDQEANRSMRLSTNSS